MAITYRLGDGFYFPSRSQTWQWTMGIFLSALHVFHSIFSSHLPLFAAGKWDDSGQRPLLVDGCWWLGCKLEPPKAVNQQRSSVLLNRTVMHLYYLVLYGMIWSFLMSTTEGYPQSSSMWFDDFPINHPIFGWFRSTTTAEAAGGQLKRRDLVAL